MKLIMENWRGFLKEDMDPRIERKVNMLLDMKNDSGFLGVELRKMGRMVRIHYIWMLADGSRHIQVPEGRPSPYGANPARKMIPEGVPSGQIVIMNNPAGNGPCDGSYIVNYVKATDGWGPLLYEIALEWASVNGDGLAADRAQVEDAALSVWDKYAERVDGEQLTTTQLDVSHDPNLPGHATMINYPQLNDNPKDDCVQLKSIEVGDKKWNKTPIAKKYKKNNQEVIEFLKNKERWK